jgi:hypothetical protein
MENQPHRRSTDRIGICLYHTGMSAEVENLKANVTDLWKAVNSIKNRTTATMTSVLIAVGMFILNMIIPFHAK